MKKYILGRVVIALVTVFVVITLTFILMRLIPGTPFNTGNTNMDPEALAQLEANYGLDKPIWQQYLTYMGNLLHGDLGYSLRSSGRSVMSYIREFFPVSAKLGLYAMLVYDCIGLFFGILCSQYRGKWPDYVLLVFAVVCVALPSMVVGPLLRYYLGAKLKWFPVSGWGTGR